MADPLIIAVAYHCDEDLRGALAALGGGFVVVVVDNDPNPATEAITRAARAEYVPAPGNIGFAAGVNLGLDHAWEGQDVLLLNPDARIGSAGVRELQQALHARHRCAAVGPSLTSDNGRAQNADWPVPSPGQVWSDAVGLGRRWKGPRFVTGAVLLLNGEALTEIGRLDERYFLYAEEADWQLRAQRAGWTVGVVDDVIATHAGARSSSDPAARERHFHRSAAAFARRWYGPLGWQIMRGGSIIAAGRRLITSDPIRRAEASRTLRTYVRRADGEPR